MNQSNKSSCKEIPLMEVGLGLIQALLYQAKGSKYYSTIGKGPGNVASIFGYKISANPTMVCTCTCNKTVNINFEDTKISHN